MKKNAKAKEISKYSEPTVESKELFVDSETDGLVPSGAVWEKHYKMFPHILQLSWKINGKAKDFFIYQEGRAISSTITGINGITTKIANDKNTTVEASKVYADFLADAMNSNIIVGHNLYFDLSIIKANVLRTFGTRSVEADLLEEALNKEKRIDTMKKSQKFMGNGKWPKLTELYFRLFNKKFDAHNALNDMLATEKCYYELKRLKVI